MLTLIFTFMAAMADPGVPPQAQPAVPPEVYEAHARFEPLQKALDLYHADCGHYPPTSSGLEALVQPSVDCEHWGPEPYLNELPTDAHGRAYMYFGSNKSYLLREFGRDGLPGGEGPDRDLDYPRGEINFYRNIGTVKPAPPSEPASTAR